MSVHNELDDAFQRARVEGRALLIPYLTAGYPDPSAYVDLCVAVLDAGADMLEIGIPFSDPLLDGPSIQRAQVEALAAGVTPLDCLRYAAEIRERRPHPLLLMGAYNPIFALGAEWFCREARAAGVSGLIVPDLPFEEQSDLRGAANSTALHVIQLAAPTSTEERLQKVCAAASGFVYCISVAGLTGARAGVAEAARPLVERVRACTSVPVAVGFGISGPQAAQAVGAIADGVIVGAALIDTVTNAPSDGVQRAAADFVSSLAGALSPSPAV